VKRPKFFPISTPAHHNLQVIFNYSQSSETFHPQKDSSSSTEDSGMVTYTRKENQKPPHRVDQWPWHIHSGVFLRFHETLTIGQHFPCLQVGWADVARTTFMTKPDCFRTLHLCGGGTDIVSQAENRQHWHSNPHQLRSTCGSSRANPSENTA
jgi:hypothetical protein